MGDVDEAVGCKLRVHRGEMQRIVAGRRLWRLPCRLRQQHTVAHHAQAPRLLGDQHRLRVRERDAPGMDEAGRHRAHSDSLAGLCVEFGRQLRRWLLCCEDAGEGEQSGDGEQE